MTNYRTWYDPPRKETDVEPFPGSPDDMMNTTASLRARVAELEAALKGAWHALESYAHGNGSPELAISIAAHCKAVLGQESGK